MAWPLKGGRVFLEKLGRFSMSLIHGQYVDQNGIIREVPILVDPLGRPLVSLATQIAGSRLEGAAIDSFLVTQREWNYTPYNPRVASTGASKGAAGAAGNLEILVVSGPVFVGGIITENDTVAGDILIRDATAVGSSVSARAFASVLNTVSSYDLDWKFANGLTACGSLAGVAFTVKWKVAG